MMFIRPSLKSCVRTSILTLRVYMYVRIEAAYRMVENTLTASTRQDLPDVKLRSNGELLFSRLRTHRRNERWGNRLRKSHSVKPFSYFQCAYYKREIFS